MLHHCTFAVTIDLCCTNKLVANVNLKEAVIFMRTLKKRWYVSAALLLILSASIWQGVPFISSHYSHANIHQKGAATTPIQHVVVIMLENRTFDNLFGRFPGANGITEPRAPDPLRSDFYHAAAGLLAAEDGGKWDEFPLRGQVQYTQQDIPDYWSYAQHYGLGDDFFTSVAANSTPNHLAMVASQSDDDDDSTVGASCTAPQNDLIYSKNKSSGAAYWNYPCYNIASVPQLLQNAGLTWRYYSESAIWDAPALIKSTSGSSNDVHDSQQFVTDVNACNLANVSWVTPYDVYTDHPPSSLQGGQSFVTKQVDAIMQSKCNYWKNTAIFVTWDDWGGFYDHVIPPVVDGLGLGPRTPLLAISAYSKPGYISHKQGEFSSFDKFIEEDFGLPNLGQRDALAQTSDLMDYFDFSQPPSSPLIIPSVPFNPILRVPHGRGASLGKEISGAVDPEIGGPNTVFTFSIQYVSKVLPTIHEVTIDGNSFNMTRGADYEGHGPLYSYSTKLSVGTHNFTYTFSSGTGSGTTTLPDNGVPFSAPAVFPFNVSPSISPHEVLPGQPVTYSVVYKSPAGKQATEADVDIDGIPYAMTTTGGDPTKGVTYTYTTSSLAQGQHYYRFRFNDGSGEAIYEGIDEPTVTPFSLSAGTVQPTSGTNTTTFTFQTTYANPSGNAPQIAQVYIDGTGYPMTCMTNCNQAGYIAGAGFSYSTELPNGSHTFYFVFNDGESAWSHPYGISSFAGPNVGANAQPVPPGTTITPSLYEDPDGPMDPDYA